jgi:hypothetical protein
VSKLKRAVGKLGLGRADQKKGDGAARTLEVAVSAQSGREGVVEAPPWALTPAAQAGAVEACASQAGSRYIGAAI